MRSTRMAIDFGTNETSGLQSSKSSTHYGGHLSVQCAACGGYAAKGIGEARYGHIHGQYQPTRDASIYSRLDEKWTSLDRG